MPSQTSLVQTLLQQEKPIAQELIKLFGGRWGDRKVIKGTVSNPGKQRSNAKGILPRTDIVDEKLCDDVITYLAPSLEPYKGCTLIDVHPGACVWSRKLHDFLKPERHILMEPEAGYFETFIRPLLELPNSNYRHTELSGAHPKAYWANYETIFSDGKLMTPRPSLDKGDTSRTKLDTSLLVTGNLARRYPHQSASRNAPFAQLILHHMTGAALTNEIFHSRGPVRSLWWMPEVYKPLIVPGVAGHRRSYMLGLRLGASINDVVGVQPVNAYFERAARASDRRQRLPSILLQDQRIVQQRMDEVGMKLPEGRETHRMFTFEPSEAVESVSPMSLKYATIDDAVEAARHLQQRWSVIVTTSAAIALKRKNSKQASSTVVMSDESTFEDHDDIEFLTIPRKSKAEVYEKDVRALLDTMVHPQCHAQLFASTAKASLKDRPSIQPRLALCLDAQLRLVNLEVHLSHFASEGKDVEELRTLLLGLDASIHAYLEENSTFAIEAIRLLEDEHTFWATPQILETDRRPFEPLQASVDDFWPRTELSLVDLVPTERDMSIPGIVDAKEGLQTMQEFLKYIFLHRSTPLPTVLDMIAPNAAQDLLPLVPDITDARKGGRLNPDRVTPKTMSLEMIEGLCKAWFEWPFRPKQSVLSLDASTGAAAGRQTGADEESLADVPGVHGWR